MERLHIVVSLVPSQHADLLEVPLEQHEPLPGEWWSGARAYRGMEEVIGRERTVEVTFTEPLFSRHAHGLMARLAKCVRLLERLAKRLAVWHQARGTRKKPSGRASTRVGVQRQVDRILSARHMRPVITVEVGMFPDGIPILTYAGGRESLPA